MDYIVKTSEYFSFSAETDKAIGRIRSEAKEFLMITIGEDCKNRYSRYLFY